MGQTGRWLALIAASLAVFALCVWVGDLVLPWDRPERIGTGAGAGAVITGVLGAWVSSRIGSTPPSPPAGPPSGGPAGPRASGERSVATAENSGVIITGDGGTVQR
jgi:hypothetical protein